MKSDKLDENSTVVNPMYKQILTCEKQLKQNNLSEDTLAKLIKSIGENPGAEGEKKKFTGKVNPQVTVLLKQIFEHVKTGRTIPPDLLQAVLSALQGLKHNLENTDTTHLKRGKKAAKVENDGDMLSG